MDHANILDNHNVIFWDFDETLWNGVNSEFYQRYVKNNPHKYHYIITFRTKNQAASLWKELEEDGIIDKSNINGLFYAPDSLYIQKQFFPEVLQGINHKTVKKDDIDDILLKYNITWEKFYEANDIIHRWKPSICKTVGGTILIDDLSHIVKDDCDKLDIEYLNSSIKSE